MWALLAWSASKNESNTRSRYTSSQINTHIISYTHSLKWGTHFGRWVAALVATTCSAQVACSVLRCAHGASAVFPTVQFHPDFQKDMPQCEQIENCSTCEPLWMWIFKWKIWKAWRVIAHMIQMKLDIYNLIPISWQTVWWSLACGVMMKNVANHPMSAARTRLMCYAIRPCHIYTSINK